MVLTTHGTSPSGLLDELLALPAEERGGFLRAQADPTAVLESFVDEVERVAVAEVSKAIEAARIVTELTDATAPSSVRSRARRAYAHALSYAGNFSEALPLYREAVETAEAAGEPLEAAMGRMSSVHPLACLGRFAEAVAAGTAAREAFLACGDVLGAARADANLGATYQMSDNPAAALMHFERARAGMGDDPVALAKLDSNRGHALTHLDRFAEAQAAYEAALPVFEKNGMGWAVATVEGNLAELHMRQGRLHRAMYHYERAIRHMEGEDAHADLARLRAEQAETLASLGLLDEAIGAFERALPELKEHGLAFEEAQAHTSAGRAMLRQNRLEEADVQLRSAAEIFDALGHVTARASVDLIRAELARARGIPDGVKLAEAALGALSQLPAQAAAARHWLAQAALEADDLGTAQQHLAAALKDADRLNLTPLVADLLHLRGRLHARRGERGEAEESFGAAVDAAERVRGALQAEQFRSGYQRDRVPMYEDLVNVIADGGAPDAPARAFDVIERAKSRALLDLLSGALGADPLDLHTGDQAEDRLRGQLADARARLNALYSRLADRQFEKDAAGDPEALFREIRTAEQTLGELERRLASTAGAGAAMATPRRLAEIQPILGPATRLIEYFILGDELMAIVAAERSARVFRRLCSVEDLHARLSRAQFQIRRALRPGASNAGRQARLVADAQRELQAVHAAVFEPLEDAVASAERLIIVPHARLHGLPFGALFDGERYLIQRFEIVQVPSASSFHHWATLSDHPEARGSQPLVIGVSDAVAPMLENEAREVAAILEKAHALLGADATRGRVISAARRATLLHAACHGYFSPESPLGSGLKLADGWLTVSDAAALGLKGTLVILSGCETGRSAVTAADELLGLVRGFMAGGARGLIVSLWAVQDESAPELMRHYYRVWRGAEGRASAALRAAQLAQLQRHPHPAFWSSFIYVGGEA